MKNYICFTTIPSRFNNLNKIITYISNTFKEQYDGIKIYIPNYYIRFPQPYKIPILNGADIVIIDKDWGPATKFIGPVKDNSINDDDNIFIMDDDVLKDINWLNISKLNVKRYPNSVIQLRVCTWENKPIPLKTLQIHGVSGFCFKKNILNNKKFFNFIEKLPLDLYFIDDDILTYYLYHNKIPITMTSNIIKRQYLLENDSLSRQSGSLKRNILRNKAFKFFNNKFLFKYLI